MEAARSVKFQNGNIRGTEKRRVTKERVRREEFTPHISQQQGKVHVSGVLWENDINADSRDLLTTKLAAPVMPIRGSTHPWLHCCFEECCEILGTHVERDSLTYAHL